MLAVESPVKFSARRYVSRFDPSNEATDRAKARLKQPIRCVDDCKYAIPCIIVPCDPRHLSKANGCAYVPAVGMELATKNSDCASARSFGTDILAGTHLPNPLGRTGRGHAVVHASHCVTLTVLSAQ